MSTHQDGSTPTIITAIRLLRRRERNLGRNESTKSMVSLLESFTKLTTTLGTEMSKRFQETALSCLIAFLDILDTQIKEIREQILALSFLGRDVEKELNKASSLEKSLDEFLHQVNEDLLQNRQATTLEDVMRILESISERQKRITEWINEFYGLQEGVDTRINDLFKDVGILMRELNANQLQEAFFG